MSCPRSELGTSGDENGGAGREVGEVGELVRIAADAIEFLLGTGIPKDVALNFGERAGGVSGPEFFAGAPHVSFDAEVLLVGHVVADVEPIVHAHHAFVVGVDVPVVFGEGDAAHSSGWVVKNGGETDALDAFV